MFKRRSKPVFESYDPWNDVALADVVQPPATVNNPVLDAHNGAIYQVQCYLFGKAMASEGRLRTDYLLLRAEIDPIRITVTEGPEVVSDPTDSDDWNPENLDVDHVE